MGEVYRAKDTRLGRDVAIKVLPEEFFEVKRGDRGSSEEAKLLASLNHPNIAAIYSFEEIPDPSSASRHILIMELLEGETLRAALSGGKLPPRRAIDYALQIAHGLAAAHEKGIVHRDLKPENLFVTRDGRVKILDFGLAKLTHQEEGGQATNLPTASAGTEPGVVMGTLGYMSPEQVKGKSADARSDIFSFGAILYEMLSGQRAFHGDSAAETMSAISGKNRRTLVTNQSVSPGLERIVRHCIEKNPEQRFHSAHDLALNLSLRMLGDDLRRAPDAIQAQARMAPTMASVSGSRWRRRSSSSWPCSSSRHWAEPSRAAPLSTGGSGRCSVPDLARSRGSTFFADGMTEDILTQLAKIHHLKVISPYFRKYVPTETDPDDRLRETAAWPRAESMQRPARWSGSSAASSMPRATTPLDLGTT